MKIRRRKSGIAADRQAALEIVHDASGPAEASVADGLFFKKGFATAEGFRPSYWVYERRDQEEAQASVQAPPSAAAARAAPTTGPAVNPAVVALLEEDGDADDALDPLGGSPEGLEPEADLSKIIIRRVPFVRDAIVEPAPESSEPKAALLEFPVEPAAAEGPEPVRPAKPAAAAVENSLPLPRPDGAAMDAHVEPADAPHGRRDRHDEAAAAVETTAFALPQVVAIPDTAFNPFHPDQAASGTAPFAPVPAPDPEPLAPAASPPRVAADPAVPPAFSADAVHSVVAPAPASGRAKAQIIAALPLVAELTAIIESVLSSKKYASQQAAAPAPQSQARAVPASRKPVSAPMAAARPAAAPLVLATAPQPARGGGRNLRRWVWLAARVIGLSAVVLMLWVNILTSWFAAGRPLAEYLNPFAAPPVASDQAAAGAVKSPRQAPRPAVPQ